MDSLTQVVLGAAVGEAVLGRKVGHRAMLWGAFAGFLPDLDITSSLVFDEITALRIHRGITHSIFFAVFFPFLLAWVVQALYAKGIYKRAIYKQGMTIVGLIAIMLTANFLPYMVTEAFNPKLFAITFGIAGALYLLLNYTYLKKNEGEVHTTYSDWYWLFFWGILTHPILDSFTAYGTQLFLPFSDYRVAFNVISVVDPIYTVPFILFVTIASLLHRGAKWRPIVNWTGIGLSSLYLLFCYYHKTVVNKSFERALTEADRPYSRYMTSPVIFNNVLWIGVAEDDSSYHHGYYSFLNEEKEFAEFNDLPKRHDLLVDYEDDPTLKTLRWFSNDYYTLMPRTDGTVQYNDARYGILDVKLDGADDYVFKFILTKENGGLEMNESRDRPDLNKETFRVLWNRIMGRW